MPGSRRRSAPASLFSADGLAITNYHVVSQAVLRAENLSARICGGRRQPWRAQRGRASTCQTISRSFALPSVTRHFPPSTALRWKSSPPKGERLYSMGNPLDLGFTIIEGTYNGLVDRTYNDRVHFSGALNPGMSGGPTVSAEGTGRWRQRRHPQGRPALQLPGAGALCGGAAAAGARGENPAGSTGRDRATTRSVAVGAPQIVCRERVSPSTALGPYLAPETVAPWFNCWAKYQCGRHAPAAPPASIRSTARPIPPCMLLPT